MKKKLNLNAYINIKKRRSSELNIYTQIYTLYTIYVYLYNTYK